MNDKRFRIVDIIVLVFFISTAFLGLYLFQQDLMQTFDTRDMEPAGILIIRNNIVQRRHYDRVLWDRVFVDSPVYPGDLVRVADLSSAALDIEDNEIFINENTLIRIQANMDGRGNFQVELREGNISVTSGAESQGIVLDIMGSQIMALSGSVLDASAGDEGIAVQVNEGIVELIQDGQTREITEGTMVAFDQEGVERILPSAVVTRPVTNARFLKNSREMLAVNFAWNRINLDTDEMLRLELAADFNFRNNYRRIDGLNNSALVNLDAGQWHWKLSFGDTLLRRGWFTIFDSSGPMLTSPVMNSVFRYKDERPSLRFQWAEREGASGYLVEISDTQDFSAVTVSRRISSSSLIMSELGHGTWYWRVRPVFLSSYEGETSYSQVSSFKVEQTVDIVAPAVEIPAASIERAIAIRPEPVRSIRHYTIQPGDTLGRIANRFYGDPMLWVRIVNANNIPNPDLIFPGQVCVIP